MPTIAAESIQAELRRLKLPNGLVIDRLTLNGEGLSAEIEPASITARKPAVFKAILLQEDVVAFASQRLPEQIKSLELELIQGQIHVKATAHMVVDVPAKATCVLKLDAPNRINLVAESVSVLGVGATGLVTGHLEALNPLFDASEIPFDLSISRATVELGHIVVEGLSTLALR